MFDHRITRRESLHTLLKLTGTAAVAAAGLWPSTAPSASQQTRFLIEAVAESEKASVAILTRKTFEAAGGIGQFVSKGDVVLIKPNISWARPPKMAATTNPEVLQAVIELCQEAGAKKVRIADNTIDNANFCFSVSGAADVAKITGAELINPDRSLMRRGIVWMSGRFICPLLKRTSSSTCRLPKITS